MFPRSSTSLRLHQSKLTLFPRSSSSLQLRSRLLSFLYFQRCDFCGFQCCGLCCYCMIHASRPLECIIHARENFGTWLKHARENSCKGALLRTPRYHIINWCEIISDQTRSLKWEDLYKHFGLIRMCEPENKHWRRSQHGEKYSQLWDRPHHHPQKTGKNPGTDRITPL